MRSRREMPAPDEARSPSLLEIVDALILYDDPVLDRRFQDAIAMHPDPAVREALFRLPSRVAEGSRHTRRAGAEWDRVSGGTLLDDAFRGRAERYLLEALLESAEAQIRLKTFLAAHAPTRQVRDLIEDAIDIHRELADTLRDALDRLDVSHRPPRDEGAPFVGAADEAADLRGQVEAAIRRMRAGGRSPRALLLSTNAVRRLRDQGAFASGSVAIMDVPVEVEMAWKGWTYALRSFDSIPLEEMAGGH